MEVETAKERLKRYERAKAVMDLWHGRNKEVYRYFFPYRDDIYVTTEGEWKQNAIFDETGQISGRQFANKLQDILMPPFQRWIELQAGDVIKGHKALSEDEKEKIDEKLQKDTEILFKYITESNFALSVNESFQDLTVGTGFIQISEGDLTHPLHFSAVSIGKITTSEGIEGRLDNFWREWEIPIEDIQVKWPDASLPANLTKSRDKQNKVCLVEGCIKYNENDDDHKYFYYVQLKEKNIDIVKRWKPFNPFTGFRYDKAPGQTLGMGVATYALPAVKMLNKMAELDIKAFKYRAFPAYIDASGRALNPNTARIEPGSLIVVNPEFASAPPIQPIPVGGNPQFAKLDMQLIRDRIREMMMVEPLGDVNQTPSKTATEMSIRQQNYIRKNAAAASRLAVELIEPLVTKSLEILRKKGLIQDIQTSAGIFRIGIKDKVVSLNYKSPIISLQESKDVQTFTNWVTLIMEMYGQQGAMASMERFQVPEWVAEKLGVDLTLIKNDKEFESEVVGAAQKVAQYQQQQQQQQQQVAPQTATPSLPQI